MLQKGLYTLRLYKVILFCTPRLFAGISRDTLLRLTSWVCPGVSPSRRGRGTCLLLSLGRCFPVTDEPWVDLSQLRMERVRRTGDVCLSMSHGLLGLGATGPQTAHKVFHVSVSLVSCLSVSLCLSVCLPVCLSLSVCLSVCLSLCLSAILPLCLSVNFVSVPLPFLWSRQVIRPDELGPAKFSASCYASLSSSGIKTGTRQIMRPDELGQDNVCKITRHFSRNASRSLSRLYTFCTWRADS